MQEMTKFVPVSLNTAGEVYDRAAQWCSDCDGENLCGPCADHKEAQTAQAAERPLVHAFRDALTTGEISTTNFHLLEMDAGALLLGLGVRLT